MATATDDNAADENQTSQYGSYLIFDVLALLTKKCHVKHSLQTVILMIPYTSSRFFPFLSPVFHISFPHIYW